MLKNLAEEINIHLNNEQIEKFDLFYDLLIEWNQKFNLTSITEKQDVYLKHFVDSLIIFKYIKNKNQNIIDVGTGAGFPSVPLSIICENDFLLLDSLNKRISFLNEVKNFLNLENIETIHARAEELAHNGIYREKFEIVCSRAVANLRMLSEFCLPFLKVGGIFIAMKGSNYADELYNSKEIINILGCKIETVEEINLPQSDIKRSIIIIKKEKNTPKKYPRKMKEIKKTP